MIRFLQTDNRLTKALFVVIIAAASVSMVVYLIPGLTGQGAASARHLCGDLSALVQPLLSSAASDQPGEGRARQPASRCSSAESAVRRQSDDREHV